MSGALTPLSTRNLRLYFRLVNGSAPRSILLSHMSHTDGHVLPPTEAMPPTSQAPGTATLILRLRRYPRPRPRCTVRLCTDFAPATMATVSLTPSSLRHTARSGRLTLKPQADFRDSLSLRKLCDTPLCCLLQVRFTPSPLFTSATRRIVITAHRHVKPLDLIVSASRESGGCRARQFSTNGNLTCTAAI